MSASHTTNLNLNKPARTDFVSVVTDINDNMDILDTKIGAIPQNKTVQGQIDSLDSGKVPGTRTVNGKALSSNVTVMGSDIPMNVSDNTKVDVAISDLKSALHSNSYWIGYPINEFDARRFSTTNTTNFTLTATETDLTVVHNNSYSTGMPVANLGLEPGTYILSADFTQTSVKTIQLLVDGSSSASQNIENGDSFEIESGHTYRFRYYTASAGTYIVKGISVYKVPNGQVQRIDAELTETGMEIDAINLVLNGKMVNVVGETDIYLKTGETVYFDVSKNTVSTNVYTSPYESGDNVTNIPADFIGTLSFTASKDGYIKLQETATEISVMFYRKSLINGRTYTVKKDGSGDFSSFVDALESLKGASYQKTILVYDGEYDIYDELGGDAFIETITNPSQINWKDVNPVVPPNTTVLGVGNVTLKFAPEANKIGSDAMAFLFSPLNVQGSCHIENISIFAKNCRYAIHDESSSDSQYDDAQQIFINVRATKEKGTYGNNDCFGAGIGARANWKFQNCEFYGDRDYVFSIHTNASSALDEAFVTLENCVVKLTGTNTIAFRLFSGTGGHNATENLVKLNNCYLDGSLILTTNTQNSIQRFNVHTLNTYIKNGISVSDMFAENPYIPVIVNTITG